jgi:hypothetical protein
VSPLGARGSSGSAGKFLDQVLRFLVQAVAVDPCRFEVVLGGPQAQRPPGGAPELVSGQPAFPVAASERPVEQPPGARRVDTECAVQVLEGSSRSSTSAAFTPAYQTARLGTRLPRVYYTGGPDDAEYEHRRYRGGPPATDPFGQVTALA